MYNMDKFKQPKMRRGNMYFIAGLHLFNIIVLHNILDQL